MLAYTVEVTHGLPVLGPSDFRSHSAGLTLVQTSSEASQTVRTGSNPLAADEGAADDPCVASLNKALADKNIVDSPADALITFIEDYCTDAADDYLPSKFDRVPHFSSFFQRPGKDCSQDHLAGICLRCLTSSN